MSGAGRGFAALAAAAVVAGFVATTPSGTTGLTAGGESGPVEEAGPAGNVESSEADGPATQGAAGGDGAGVGSGSGGPARATATKGGVQAGLECKPGRNGGATDEGVTATRIKVASTAVLDGPAASLLSASPTAMQAVVNKANRAGGICGRQIELTVVNDGFDGQRGGGFLRNFIDQGYFALPVVPSAEGLSAAISSTDIAKAGIPVVGTDGMRIEQYNEPWVWPVATSTASAMRIMAHHGSEKLGAKTFAIVWDNKYKFGVEGAEAFAKEVEKLGGRLVADIGLNPSQPSYSSEVQEFNSLCGNGKCDMVAMLLLPDAARTWMAAGPQPAAKYTAAAQTLFSDNFAQACVQVAKTLCHGIAVWTGYNPPIGTAAATPGIQSYVGDVRALDPRIDVKNQFVQGAYLGMTLFVEALKKAGPQLTRERLREALDSMTLSTDLAPPLTWRPGNHHANGRARAFSIVVSQGTFTGWRDEQTGFVADPTLGAKP